MTEEVESYLESLEPNALLAVHHQLLIDIENLKYFNAQLNDMMAVEASAVIFLDHIIAEYPADAE